MVVGDQHGLFRGIDVHPGWAEAMCQGLSDCPDHEAGPHARGKQHAEPGRYSELGLVLTQSMPSNG